MNRFLNLIRLFIKETFRDKLSVLFTLFFPIIFIVIFGNLFFTTSSEEPIYNFGIHGKDLTEIEEFLSPNNVNSFNSIESLKEAVEKEEIDVGIHFEDSLTVELVMREENLNNFENSMKLRNLATSAVKRSYIGTSRNVIQINEEVVSVGRREAYAIDYLVSAVLALTILSGGMFSTIGVFGDYKKQGIIKRFLATPIKPWEFVISASLSKLLLNFVAILVVIFLSRSLYNVIFEFNWLIFLLIIINTSIGMMGIGVLMLLIFKKTETAYTGGSIFYTVMTFFSGLYFPISVIPGGFRWISRFLPITYLIEILRFAAGFESMSIQYFTLLNTIFFLVGGGLILLASKKFVNAESQ
ncbi:UNVERIFIED_CONTAM: ABC-2 type transport system permease protein [Acetivibrio alkalicellulosi]